MIESIVSSLMLWDIGRLEEMLRNVLLFVPKLQRLVLNCWLDDLLMTRAISRLL